ncbi:MAG: GntR family transcriptional regulator [Steroidobacteraceae bacterium]
MNSKPLSDEVFENVLALIFSGELLSGAPVNEVGLAQRFGVSRGPVREAVRRLQGLGLVSREAYTRARVVNLTAQDVLELFQMREVLEGLACRLAAERMSEEEIAQLSAGLEQARHALFEDGPGAPDSKTFDFHDRIVRASGNQRIIDALCGDLYHLLRLYRRSSGAVVERKDAAYAEHWQIIRALKTRDGDLAESLMRSHIARAARNVVVRLSEHDVRGSKHLTLRRSS